MEENVVNNDDEIVTEEQILADCEWMPSAGDYDDLDDPTVDPMIYNIEYDFSDRVILNVGGTKFETFTKILKKIPATRLSRLTEALVNYDPVKNEYFFDRNPGVFNHIMSYYNSGKLHYPTNVCGPLFEEELAFWGLDMNCVEPCCWRTYNEHRATEETLAALDRLNIDNDRSSKNDLIIKFCVEEDRNGKIPLFKRFQPVLWQLFEEPRSSKAAKFIAYFNISMIVFSVVMLWLRAYSQSLHEVIQIPTQHNNDTSASIRMLNTQILRCFLYADYITISWFTFQFSIRLLVTPSRPDFFKNMHNSIDFIAIIWFYVDAIVYQFYSHPILSLIESIRVLRLLQIFSFNPGLKVLMASLAQSVSVLRLLLIIMAIASTIFGSFVYYAEKLTIGNIAENKFISIPDGFWYAIVSLTTIGYGDYAPTSAMGQLIGSVCVFTGVLMIGLPMTIIVEIFSNFYRHLGARSKLPKQRRRVLPVEALRVRKKDGGQNTANKVAPVTEKF